MIDLYPWPDIKRIQELVAEDAKTSKASHNLPTVVVELTYNKMLAKAALARLRVAVEALKEIRSVHPLMHNGGNWDKFVDEALQAIGEIPGDV